LAVKVDFRILVKELLALRAGNDFLKKRPHLNDYTPNYQLLKMGKKVNKSNDFDRRAAWPRLVGITAESGRAVHAAPHKAPVFGRSFIFCVGLNRKHFRSVDGNL
jgi:hypothetical protein